MYLSNMQSCQYFADNNISVIIWAQNTVISGFILAAFKASPVLVDLKLKYTVHSSSTLSPLSSACRNSFCYHPDDDVCCLWWGVITLPQIHL